MKRLVVLFVLTLLLGYLISDIFGFGKMSLHSDPQQDEAIHPFKVLVCPGPVGSSSFTVQLEQIMKGVPPDYVFRMYDQAGKEVRTLHFHNAAIDVSTWGLKGRYRYKVFVGEDLVANSSLVLQ